MPGRLQPAESEYYQRPVILPEARSSVEQSFAFKTYEPEELADLYFFRPLGSIIARGARALRLTPIHLTIFGTLAGAMGGTLLYSERAGWPSFAFLLLYGIIDSADGQLARMTGQVTELGRVLDGVSGYVTTSRSSLHSPQA
jgi:hypothetical protein